MLYRFSKWLPVEEEVVMAKVKVIVELRHTEGIANLSTSGMAMALEPTAASETIPQLPGLQLDCGFAPVMIPAPEFPALTEMAPPER
jgi:hypothetical protein